ncbi:MAG TPA: hypothetical protein PKN33_20135 [Phycisphaerae bacterium]|nr:hypothetical protein [Phycisphaerae bacterium]
MRLNNNATGFLAIAIAVTGMPQRSNAQAQEDVPNQVPWELRISLAVDETSIEAYEPLIARVALLNADERPATIMERVGGGPAFIEVVIRNENGVEFVHDQRLRRSGPERIESVLFPGESTSGELLVMFGGPPTGCAFSEPGTYELSVIYRSDSTDEPIRSNKVQVLVKNDEHGNRKLLDRLSEITYEHFGYDREVMTNNNGPEFVVAFRLLPRIVGQIKPWMIDRDGSEESAKMLQLVDSLTEIVEQFPDALYSRYISRYLGLFHLKTVEHSVSRQSHECNDAFEDLVKAHSDFSSAEHHLERASKLRLWPSTTALENLGMLRLLAGDWKGSEDCVTKLSTDVNRAEGREAADRLEKMTTKLKEKIRRRELTQSDGS